MSAAITLVVADHGHLVSAVPFVLPAFLVVATIVALRFHDRRRDNPDD